MPSDRFDVGFAPRDAYTLLAYTVLLIDSGNAICVTLTERLLTFTSMWMCVARPWYQPG